MGAAAPHLLTFPHLHQPRKSLHPRPLRRRLHRRLRQPSDHQHHLLEIPSTAQLILRTLGPPPIIMPVPQPAPPADPYNCADGFANWQAGWSVAKKEWCCRVHGKGCPNQGGGCVTSSKPYDCDAGFANWMAGWSVAKKAWCCANKGKGCPPAAGGCA